jgi:DNA-binding MarR family transcriptional regulator
LTASLRTDSPPDLELAERLRLAVTRLSRRLRQQSADRLTPSQTSALSSIERHGPLTPSEIATLERIQRPTATRLLSGLIEAGLVTREADTRDRRMARVRVTREGAAVLKRIRSRKDAYLVRRLRALEPEELQLLERATGLIERLIADDRGADR